MLGVIGGAIAGLTGVCVRAKRGWTLAGVMGGVVPAALVISGSGASHSAINWLIGLTCVAVGSALGLAVGAAQRSGASAVPGVQGLVSVLRETKAAERGAARSAAPTEVAPAVTPEGRGNEAAPPH
jgi:hypothetical protein